MSTRHSRSSSTKQSVSVDNRLIDFGKSPAGGWSRQQLEILGVSWPPKPGWKKRIIGKKISALEAKRFIDLCGMQSWKSYRGIQPRTFKKKPRRHNRKSTDKRYEKPVKYETYIHSKTWMSKRREAFKYHGRRCHVCGNSRGLRIHHLSYANLGNEPMEDLRVLCWECHDVEHEDKYMSNDSLSVQFRQIVAAGI